MSFCCSQCSFTTQFESALTMHRQLRHGSTIEWDPNKLKITNEKSNTVPRVASQERPHVSGENKDLKLARTSSATKLLGKLRARICRSKTLFVHPEEGADELCITNSTSPAMGSSRVLKSSLPSCTPISEIRRSNQETFACHLCPFDADRITVLDRHLLIDHKIGLENLLKLVMAKTQDGLSENETASDICGIRQPYYKPVNDTIEEGEFVIETVTPKIKILRHATVNTDLKGSDIIDLLKYQNSEDVDKLTDLNDNKDLMAKMQTLNECMYKFVDSSNMLKKVLTKEFDQKNSTRSEKLNEKPIFDLGLGDQESPRKWERAHSEKLERSRSKYGESRSGSEKIKVPSESFYF